MAMPYTLSKTEKERWDVIKDTVEHAADDSLYHVYRKLVESITDDLVIDANGAATSTVETMDTFRILWRSIEMYRAYHILGEMDIHETARRFSIAGIYDEYDAGLIPLKDISNTQIIEAMDIGKSCDDEKLIALAVSMSMGRGNHVQDNLDDAHTILDNHLIGDWRYCLAFIKNKDCDWIRNIFIMHDITYMNKDGYRNIMLRIKHAIENRPAWDSAIDRFIDESCGSINGHVIYSPQNVYDEIRDGIFDSDMDRAYVLRRLYRVSKAITAAHGKDVMIISRKSLFDSLHRLYNYPEEYVAEEIMMNACDVWSH
jgi:hypothetical protein